MKVSLTKIPKIFEDEKEIHCGSPLANCGGEKSGCYANNRLWDNPSNPNISDNPRANELLELRFVLSQNLVG